MKSSERGSGTVVVLGVLGLAISLLLATVALSGAGVAATRAAGAADLAALAAADAARGIVMAAEPCALAEDVASSHGAELTGCEIDSGIGVATVTVAVSWGAGAFASLPAASGQSRAGPNPADPLVNY